MSKKQSIINETTSTNGVIGKKSVITGSVTDSTKDSSKREIKLKNTNKIVTMLFKEAYGIKSLDSNEEFNFEEMINDKKKVAIEQVDEEFDANDPESIKNLTKFSKKEIESVLEYFSIFQNEEDEKEINERSLISTIKNSKDALDMILEKKKKIEESKLTTSSKKFSKSDSKTLKSIIKHLKEFKMYARLTESLKPANKIALDVHNFFIKNMVKMKKINDALRLEHREQCSGSDTYVNNSDPFLILPNYQLSILTNYNNKLIKLAEEAKEFTLIDPKIKNNRTVFINMIIQILLFDENDYIVSLFIDNMEKNLIRYLDYYLNVYPNKKEKEDFDLSNYTDILFTNTLSLPPKIDHEITEIKSENSEIELNTDNIVKSLQDIEFTDKEMEFFEKVKKTLKTIIINTEKLPNDDLQSFVVNKILRNKMYRLIYTFVQNIIFKKNDFDEELNEKDKKYLYKTMDFIHSYFTYIVIGRSIDDSSDGLDGANGIMDFNNSNKESVTDDNAVIFKHFYTLLNDEISVGIKQAGGEMKNEEVDPIERRKMIAANYNFINPNSKNESSSSVINLSVALMAITAFELDKDEYNIAQKIVQMYTKPKRKIKDEMLIEMEKFLNKYSNKYFELMASKVKIMFTMNKESYNGFYGSIIDHVNSSEGKLNGQ